MPDHSEVLVETKWVNDNTNSSNVRIVEVDVDDNAYDEGHIPGAMRWNWKKQLCDTLRRDILSQEEFTQLMSDTGLTPDTRLVLYGDNNNWFAAWAFWLSKIYGHRDVVLMDGGRRKWVAEGRPLSQKTPKAKPAQYGNNHHDTSFRALLPQVQIGSERGSVVLVDVRSPEEFAGKILAPPGSLEIPQRGGHIPRACNIPWDSACNPDGTFKTPTDLRKLYGAHGVDGTRPIITYCSIGERASHSWFVLKYLLQFKEVKNYDGSWVEWGNMVGAPVETGPKPMKHRKPGSSTRPGSSRR